MHFFALLLFKMILKDVNNISSIGKMVDEQRCVSRQYKMPVNKKVDFDRQISEG